MTTDTPVAPTFTMHPVESNQIAAIGHDPETDTLAVQFTTKTDRPGSVYHYANFDAEQFAALRGAESVGTHFNQHIKNAGDKHPYHKVP